LERAANISIELNATHLAEIALLSVLRSDNPTVSGAMKYLDLSLSKDPWDNNIDDTYRAVLTKGQNHGMEERAVAFYTGCRTLKQGLFEEASDQFYRALEAGYSPKKDVYDLILVIYFKKGEFWNILDMDVPMSDPFLNWALWVKNLDSKLKKTPKMDKCEKLWKFLDARESAVLKTFINMPDADPADLLSKFLQNMECTPSLVTMRAAYLRMDKTTEAEKIHRKLIQINSQFERE
jgi:hypothetical protein